MRFSLEDRKKQGRFFRSQEAASSERENLTLEREFLFEAYAENKTPAAYRIFWYYGPKKSQITIVAITPHP